MNYAIRAERISHSFADKKVLNNITFAVQEGEIFGLLGPSGAGKTTLIKILTGQLKQKNGSAALFGKDTAKLTALEHSRIGIMMDNWGLYERLSAYDNLLFYFWFWFLMMLHNNIDHVPLYGHHEKNLRSSALASVMPCEEAI